MKKFSIRTLLVLVLALVLVFSLVACGDKNDGGGGTPTPPPTPAEYTSQEYFTNLWNLSKGIGSEAIAANDNLAVHADLSLALATESNAGKVYQKVDLGFSIDLVLDKSAKAATSESQTALKVRVYDPTDNETWVTLYAFMSDPTCIFVDYAGQNIKIPFNYRNAELSARLDQFLTQDKVIVLNKNNPEKREELTIAQLIEKFTSDMGADWDLNKLIDRVVSLLGINLKETIGKFQSTLDGFGFTQDKLFDAQGKLDVKGILTTDLGASLFEKTSVTTNGDTKTYYTQIQSGILKTVVGMVPGFIKDIDLSEITSLVGDLTKIGLTYNEKNGEIDGFGIKLSLGNVAANDPTSKVTTKVFPTISININELSFRKATGNDVTMATARENYKTDVALDMGVTVDVSGIVLDGQLSLTLKGKVDLWNTTNNETAAVAALSYQPKDGAKVDIVKASFANGTLAVTVNQNAKIGEVPIAKTLVNLFGDHAYNMIAKLLVNNAGATNALNNLAKVMFTDEAHRELNPNFVGAAWKNIDIVTPIQNWLDKLNPFKLPVKTDANTVADAKQVVPFKNIATTIKYAIAFITTPDNNLVIALDNINKNVVKIGKLWDTNMSESGNVDEIIKKDNGNWIPDIKGLLKLAGLNISGGKDVTAEDIAMFRNVEREKYKLAVLAGIAVSPEEIKAEKAIAGNENKTDPELTDIIKNKKYAEMTAEQIDAAIVAAKGTNGVTAVRFAGKSDDEVKALIKADRDYLTSVMACSAKVVLDMSWENGALVTVEANVKQASVKVTAYVKASTFVATDYTDLAKDVTSETAGWFVLEF